MNKSPKRKERIEEENQIESNQLEEMWNEYKEERKENKQSSPNRCGVTIAGLINLRNKKPPTAICPLSGNFLTTSFLMKLKR